MSDMIGYHARYNAHASTTVRLPRPKPFTTRMLLWEDNIGAEARGRSCDEIGMRNVARGRRGRPLLYRGARQGGSGMLAAINVGVDSHAAMHDETIHCVAWESWAPLTSFDQR
jgi:hypothetical protein